MRYFFGLWVLCMAARASEMKDTDLGSLGNRWVAEKFQSYRTTSKGCISTGGSERRILVQGFGPYSGISRNLSGAVVSHLAGLSDLPQTEHGGWAVTRHLVVDGEPIEFCFVYVDVIWDLAGAILLTEMERFDPELVLMTGSGSSTTIAEGGAQNSALGLTGFDSEGNPLQDLNTPWCGEMPCGYFEQSDILNPAGPGVEPSVTLSWDNVAFTRSLRESMQLFMPQMVFESPKEARKENDYLCNNVAYIVQSAINGADIKLAGGLIAFPGRPSLRNAGFLHYQADSNPSPERVQMWAWAVARALVDQHPRPFGPESRWALFLFNE